jgi:hypothetical protein
MVAGALFEIHARDAEIVQDNCDLIVEIESRHVLDPIPSANPLSSWSMDVGIDLQRRRAVAAALADGRIE